MAIRWGRISKRKNYDEALLTRLVDGAAELGQEYFDLDAGWAEGDDYISSPGNWERMKRQKFPNGLKPFAHYVRTKGLKLGMWLGSAERFRVFPLLFPALNHSFQILTSRDFLMAAS